MAHLADETGASPSLISQWVKILMESAELKKIKRIREKELMAREARIAQLQEVVAELSTEVLWLKKRPGADLPATRSRPR